MHHAPTAVSPHTDANKSSFVTGSPACIKAQRTADAFGVRRTSRMPDHRRPVSTSSDDRQNGHSFSTRQLSMLLLVIPPFSRKSRQTPGTNPALIVPLCHSSGTESNRYCAVTVLFISRILDGCLKGRHVSTDYIVCLWCGVLSDVSGDIPVRHWFHWSFAVRKVH